MKKGKDESIIKYIIFITIAILALYLVYSIGFSKGKGEKEYNYDDTTSSTVEKISFSIDPPEVAVFEGEKVSLNPIITGTTNYTIEYSVKNTDYCTIKDNEITAIKEGQCIATAKLVSNKKTFTSKSVIIITKKNTSVPLEDVSIPGTDLLMGIGSTYAINVTKSPNNGLIQSITYTSDNKGVAAVDTRGNIVAVDEGKALITVSVNNGKFVKKINVYVRQSVSGSKLVVAPTNIKLENDEIYLYNNETREIKYEIEPSNADRNLVSFSLLNDGILTIKDNTITALKEGTTKVLVTYGNTYKEISVIVNPSIIEISGLSLSNNGKEKVDINGTYQIVAKFYPTNATNGTIRYTSLTNNICIVDENGKITGLSKGTCKINVEAFNDVQIPPKTASNTFTIEVTNNVIEPETESVVCSSVGSLTFESDNGAINKSYSEVIKSSELRDAPTKITIKKTSCVDTIKYCTYSYGDPKECTPNTTYVNPFTIRYNGVTVIKAIAYYNAGKSITYYKYVNLKNGVDR